MPAIINNNINQQVYNIHNSDTLLNQVDSVLCVLLPRAILIAGFNGNGLLLMVRYNDYKKDLPIWTLDFYEYQFINEPLLADANKVAAVFIASDKSCIVPQVLYSEELAREWLKKIHFIEAGETIASYPLRNDNAQLLYTWPRAIAELAKGYFAQAKLLPVAAYQFGTPATGNPTLICCITADAIVATLYHNKALYWHQYFDYQDAADIAYQVKLLCTQNNIDAATLHVHCTVASRSMEQIIADLAPYFPGLESAGTHVNSGANEQSWSGTLHLLQQLYTCV